MKKIPAKRLTIYIDDGERWHGVPIHEALLELFQEQRIAGMTMFRGHVGYGADQVLHTSKLLRLSENLPLKLEVVERAEKIEAILSKVCEMVGEKGVVDISDTEICRI